MMFEIVEIPEIQWRTANFKEAMALGHGWSDVGWVEGKKRFRLFWDNEDHVMKLKDNCDGKICIIENGARRLALVLARRWLEESI